MTADEETKLPEEDIVRRRALTETAAFWGHLESSSSRAPEKFLRHTAEAIIGGLDRLEAAGIDVDDPEAVQAALAELKAEQKAIGPESATKRTKQFRQRWRMRQREAEEHFRVLKPLKDPGPFLDGVANLQGAIDGFEQRMALEYDAPPGDLTPAALAACKGHDALGVADAVIAFALHEAKRRDGDQRALRNAQRSLGRMIEDLQWFWPRDARSAVASVVSRVFNRLDRLPAEAGPIKKAIEVRAEANAEPEA
jgi:hypothetical protein